MEIRFYIDPETREPHIYRHNVSEASRLLEELLFTGNELFSGFSLRRFDGRRVSVG